MDHFIAPTRTLGLVVFPGTLRVGIYTNDNKLTDGNRHYGQAACAKHEGPTGGRFRYLKQGGAR